MENNKLQYLKEVISALGPWSIGHSPSIGKYIAGNDGWPMFRIDPRGDIYHFDNSDDSIFISKEESDKIFEMLQIPKISIDIENLRLIIEAIKLNGFKFSRLNLTNVGFILNNERIIIERLKEDLFCIFHINRMWEKHSEQNLSEEDAVKYINSLKDYRHDRKGD